MKHRVRRKEAVLALHRQHPRWTAAQIARELGCDGSYVSTTLIRAGLVPPLKFKRLQGWERQAIADAYGNGEKLDALAAEFGVDMSTISRIAERNDVPRRSKGRPKSRGRLQPSATANITPARMHQRGR